jgi:5'-3' exonuclease
MGIKGLSKFLKTYIPEAIQTKSLETLRGKWVAMDANYFYFRYSYNQKDVVNYFENQIKHLRSFGIHMVYVFDGKAPVEKKKALESRREDLKRKQIQYNSTSMKDIKNLLNNCNVPYIECECESDFICCNMSRFGLVEGCFTDDMDFLPLGCKHVYRDYKPFVSTITQYSLQEITDVISMDIFIEICVYLGCDYCFKPQEYIFRCNDLNIMNLFSTYKTVDDVWQHLSEKNVLFAEKIQRDAEYFEDMSKHIDRARVILGNNPETCNFQKYSDVLKMIQTTNVNNGKIV